MSETSLHIYCGDHDDEDAALVLYSEIVPQVGMEFNWWAPEPDKFDAKAGDLIGLTGTVERLTYEYRSRSVLVGMYLKDAKKELKEAS
jgi:hypothetical protein